LVKLKLEIEAAAIEFNADALRLTAMKCREIASRSGLIAVRSRSRRRPGSAPCADNLDPVRRKLGTPRIFGGFYAALEHVILAAGLSAFSKQSRAKNALPARCLASVPLPSDFAPSPFLDVGPLSARNLSSLPASKYLRRAKLGQVDESRFATVCSRPLPR
jgi:hypothetical protein